MTASALVAPMWVQDADPTRKLAAITSSGACEEGRVLVLDFAAIRDAVGDRWSSRCADVYCTIERKIDKHVPRGSIVLRISESEYIISFAQDRGVAAKVIAFTIMEDLLSHFLGRCEPYDMIVRAVSAITGDTLETSPLSRTEVERPEGCRDVPQEAPASPRVLASTLFDVPAERISLTLAPQEVIHLASDARIGMRLAISLHHPRSDRPLASREEQSLPAASLLETNLQAIDGLRRMMETSCRPAVFILPLFLQIFTHSRSRSVIREELLRFRACDQRRLVVELTGIERGTPSSRLTEAAWQLRPFCRAVTGRAQLERSALASLGCARLSGIHVSARDLGASRLQKAARLLAAGRSARNLAPMVMAVDLPDAAALSLCRASGFTHATLAARAG